MIRNRIELNKYFNELIFINNKYYFNGNINELYNRTDNIIELIWFKCGLDFGDYLHDGDNFKNAIRETIDSIKDVLTDKVAL